MRVVCCDASEAMFFQLPVPFLKNLWPMAGVRREALVRKRAKGARQLAPTRRVAGGIAHIGGQRRFELRVSVAIANLHAVEARCVGVQAIFRMTYETKFAPRLRLSCRIEVGKPQKPI